VIQHASDIDEGNVMSAAFYVVMLTSLRLLNGFPKLC
jgi:hypothetical protein